MSFTDSFENTVLDAMLGAGATLVGGSVDIALSKADPGDDGTGLDEPVGNGYARVAVTNNGTEWPAAVSGVKSNANQVVFPAASGGNWGTITHWAMFDGATQIANGILDNGSGIAQARQVNDGDTFRFLASQLRITLD